MLKLVKRHLKNCPHRSKGRDWKRCPCPVWVEGRKDGVRIQRTLDTANWEIAADRLLELEANDAKVDVALSDAIKHFYADCRSRNIGEATISKYEETLDPFEKFCSGTAPTRVRAISLPHVEKFRDESGQCATSPTGKKIERLRTFFRYCEDREWCDKNPAKKLQKPKIFAKEKAPFTNAEWKLIEAAFDEYPTKNSFGYDQEPGSCMIALGQYVLRYSALRISDVVRLTQDRINEGRLFVRAAKNGGPIRLPLPPFVLAALDAIKKADLIDSTSGAETGFSSRP